MFVGVVPRYTRLGLSKPPPLIHSLFVLSVRFPLQVCDTMIMYIVNLVVFSPAGAYLDCIGVNISERKSGTERTKKCKKQS